MNSFIDPFNAECSEANKSDIATLEKRFVCDLSLSHPNRWLHHQGKLRKQSRRWAETKYCCLLSDIFVYASVHPFNRLSNPKILSTTGLQMIDPCVEDPGQRYVSFQGNYQKAIKIFSPQKSFVVFAESVKDKREWLTAFQRLTSQTNHTAARPAPIWVKDSDSSKCLHCSKKFGISRMRHHCRKCGILCCAECSRDRQILASISSEPVRVCELCTRRTPPIGYAITDSYPTSSDYTEGDADKE